MVFAKNFARFYDTTWNIRRLVNELFVPSAQQTRVLYCRLTGFKNFMSLLNNFSNQVYRLLFPIEKCCLNVCLNEMKFCKVSRNPKSNSYWKLQLFILKNKKVLFLKKYEVYHVPWIVLSSANRCRIVYIWLWCVPSLKKKTNQNKPKQIHINNVLWNSDSWFYLMSKLQE